MGNCSSCFKVPTPPLSTTDPSDMPEIKDETLELRRLFPGHRCARGGCPACGDARTNGNAKSQNAEDTPNGVGSNNCGSVTTLQNNARATKGFYARLPPLGRSGMAASPAGSHHDTNKQQREPSETRINALFDRYKDPHEDIILADGIERLCDDLQLSPDEFKVLVLAWKLDAEQMCQFTRGEFVNGLRGMRVDSVRGIQTRLPEIVQELASNGDQFKDLYRFTFRFGLDVVSGQRILPADMAIVLWRLVFTIREPPLLKRWLTFLETHHVRGIPRDTWNMFLNFAEIIGNDLGAYDDAEAWPSLFDDFVEYENDQMNQNITKDDIIKDSLAVKD